MKMWFRKNELTVHFSVIYILVYAGFCSINGFPMVFLVDKGFSYIQIGIIMATINLFSALIQPVYPKLLSAFPKLTIQKLQAIITGCGALTAVGMLFIPRKFAAYWVAYILISITEIGTQALTNSLTMHYMNRGAIVDFGIARGLSSAFYALNAFVFGNIMEKFGVGFLVPVNITVEVLLIIAILTLRAPETYYIEEGYQNLRNETDIKNPSYDVIAFVRKYKLFSLFLLATVVTYIGNCLMGASFAPNLVEQFHGSTRDAGNLVSIISIFEMVPMVIYTGVAKKLSVPVLVLVSAFGFIGRAFGTFFSNSILSINLTQIFQIFGYGLFTIVSVYYANMIVEAKDRILSQGLMYGVVAMGNMVANFLSGPLLEYNGIRGFLTFCLVMTTIGGLMMAFTVLKQFKPNFRKAVIK